MLKISRHYQEPTQLNVARLSHRYSDNVPRHQPLGDGSFREFSGGIEMTERRHGIALEALYLLLDMIPASKNARNRQLNDVVNIAIASLYDEVATEMGLAHRLADFQLFVRGDNQVLV